jgi:hypothetical protein
MVFPVSSSMTGSVEFLYPGTIMSLEGDDSQDYPAGDDAETSKRSERKRQREKQRRSNLSNAFDELAAFMVQVEPEAGNVEVDTKKKRKKSNEGGEDASGITRLDLIGRALRIMKRLHKENEERKRLVAGMHDRVGGQGNDNVSVPCREKYVLVETFCLEQCIDFHFSLFLIKKKVMVMVPSLAPVSDETYQVARASYPFPAHNHGYYQNSQLSQQPPPPAEYSMSLPPGRPHSQYPPNWNSYARGASGHQQALGLQHMRMQNQNPRSPNSNPDGSAGPPERR